MKSIINYLQKQSIEVDLMLVILSIGIITIVYLAIREQVIKRKV